jgi:hypothetical protein
MAKAKFTDANRKKIVALRDSGKTWLEVAEEASTLIGFPISENGARFQYKQGTGVKRDRTKDRTPKPAGSPRPSAAGRKAHSLEEFRAKFDVTKKIEDKVAELLQSGEHYFSDDDFRGLCGVSVQNWRRHAELDRFKPYQFKKPGFHAWAPKLIVSEMQEITGAQGH